MKQERSIKELLKVMLNKQELFKGGLCSWAAMLCWKKHINKKEYVLLNTYITDNRPSIFSSVDAFMHTTNLFYWKKGNIVPRIKWIKKHIKKLSK